ncbi:MAG: hypothetical protein ACLQGP_05965, partial [Isosphaeraceae bacterium]
MTDPPIVPAASFVFNPDGVKASSQTAPLGCAAAGRNGSLRKISTVRRGTARSSPLATLQSLTSPRSEAP